MTDQLTTAEGAGGGAPRRRLLAGMGAVAAGGGLLALAGTPDARASVSDASYYTYGPRRWIDTRISGGRISGGVTRTLTAFEGLGEYTFAINLTVVATQGSGYLVIYNADLDNRPSPYSSINWQGDGKVVANFNLVDLGTPGAKVWCSGGSSTSTHFIVDVLGYFYNGGAARVAPPGVEDAERKALQRLRRA